MSCIAGVGGDVPKLVRLAKSGRPTLALDECALACVRNTLGGGTRQHAIVSDWYVSNLGDAMLAHDSLVTVQQRFDDACRTCGCPAEMGLFVRHVSEGRLYCQVLVYFTSAASALAREFDAVACARPASAGLDLLAGNAKALSDEQ